MFFSPFSDWGGLYSLPKCPWGRIMSSLISTCVLLRNQFNSIIAHVWNRRFSYLYFCTLFLVKISILCILEQVLGRKSPFPLILLPQFGGYWIEGTNHELSDTVDAEQLQPLSPNTRTKLECNTTATLFRKHFLGKVSHFEHHRKKMTFSIIYNCYSLY